MCSASARIIKLALGMSENYHAMNSATDNEAKDFFRSEYELCKHRYNVELSRLQSTVRENEFGKKHSNYCEKAIG